MVATGKPGRADKDFAVFHSREGRGCFPHCRESIGSQCTWLGQH